MIHLKERYHNDGFKELLDRYMPSWKKRREESNEVVY